MGSKCDSMHRDTALIAGQVHSFYRGLPMGRTVYSGPCSSYAHDGRVKERKVQFTSDPVKGLAVGFVVFL